MLTANTSGEELGPLLRRLTTEGDLYSHASIQVHSLSPAKQETFADEVIEHFTMYSPGLADSVGTVLFRFLPSRDFYAAWPSGKWTSLSSSKRGLSGLDLELENVHSRDAVDVMGSGMGEEGRLQHLFVRVRKMVCTKGPCGAADNDDDREQPGIVGNRYGQDEL